jgi:signal peptidase I
MTMVAEASRPTARSREWKPVLILILLIPLLWSPPFLFRTFLFQWFNIPSGSMKPTLLVGDYLFVSKYAYGYSRYSLPYAPPLFSGRIFGAMPARGDVIVFRTPKDTSVDYIKRVVGLPGDRVQMQQGRLVIDEHPVNRERLSDSEDADACGLDPGAKVRRWHETLPNGVNYETYDCVDNGFYDNTPVYTVPEGHLFVLGDNRDNSVDSRVMSSIGFVPLENVVGRVGRIFWSMTEDGDPRVERIWEKVR